MMPYRINQLTLFLLQRTKIIAHGLPRSAAAGVRVAAIPYAVTIVVKLPGLSRG